MINELNRDFKGVWIPKEIWLDTNLGWTAKLLLVEIDSLQTNGECFATNDYLAKFLGVSKDRISKLISALKKGGYIEIKLVYRQGTKQIDKRIITTIGYRKKQLEGIGKNNYTPIGKNNYTPIGKNNEDINTDIINTNIINNNIYSPNPKNAKKNTVSENTIHGEIKKNSDNTNMSEKRIIKPKEDCNTSQSASQASLEKEFDEIWADYPRKEGRKKALSYYIKSRKRGVSKATILEGVINYTQYINAQQRDTQYILMGSSYFCQERWADEIELDKPTKKTSSATNTQKSGKSFTELVDDFTRQGAAKI